VLAEQSRQRWQRALAQVQLAEAQMRELHRPDRALQLESRRLAHAFVEHAHESAAARQADWKRAEGLLEQLRGQFESKQLAVRTLEKHRDRQSQGHALEQTRQAHRAADDDWLAREGQR
jgi:hypothetical protein